MMFDLQTSKILNTDLPIIFGNYTVLHYDEFPMLFYGTNSYGNVVIGSLMCEDDEEDIFRYLHLIVNPLDYENFIKCKISYRELITKQESVFLVDKNFEEVVKTYCVLPSDIPDSFLPNPKCFCPTAHS